jgi:plasmid stabilization system protein ParE
MQSRTATTFGSLSHRTTRNSFQGHVRPDLTKLPVRFWTLPNYPNYIVAYRPETNPLQILRVLHGKRNVRRILNRQLNVPDRASSAVDLLP